MRHSKLIVAACACLSAHASAQRSNVDSLRADSSSRRNRVQLLNQVVVTADRRERALADVITTTELISRDDIERTGATDLASVLIERTGIVLQGGTPTGAGVMLQGLSTERVLILLDGQPIAGRITGNFDVSRIPTSVIERVEVVKGPQSTLYGTEAMGGVINIITRQGVADAVRANAMFTAGTQSQRDGSVQLLMGSGALRSSFTAGKRNSAITPGVAALAGGLATRTDGAARLRIGDALAYAEASVLGLDERQRFRSGNLYNFGDNTQYTAKLTGSVERGVHRLTPTISFSNYDHLSRASTETKPIAGDTGQRQLQRIAQGELLYNGFYSSVVVSAGTQVRQDQTETARVPGGLRRLTSVEPFEQVEYALTPALSLIEGIRVSRSSEWGTHVSPHVAARWRLSDVLSLRASAADGYRAPDFKELYLAFVNAAAGYAVYGNPALRPESSRNLTVGAELDHHAGYLRVQLFNNSFRQFIESQLISPAGQAPTYSYGNVGNGFTRGVELEGRVMIARVSLDAGYSALATRDNTTGFSLLGRPAHTARLGATGTLPFGLSASVTGVYTGSTPVARDVVSGAVTAMQEAFPRMDVRLAHDVAGGASVIFGTDNLFDAQPALWSGYTGRHIYTAISWNGLLH